MERGTGSGHQQCWVKSKSNRLGVHLQSGQSLFLSLFFFFCSNNQAYLFKTPLREKLGDQNKTKTKPRKWSIALGFGFLIYKVLIITSTWQDYCEYERRQYLLHGGRSALAALGM